LHPRVDKIICNSIGVEQYFRKQPFLSNKKLITINKGHDPEWYRDTQPADLTQFNIPSDAFVVSCMANVRPMKGMEYLIRAMYDMPDDAPIHLILGGEGTDGPELKKLAARAPHP